MAIWLSITFASFEPTAIRVLLSATTRKWYHQQLAERGRHLQTKNSFMELVVKAWGKKIPPEKPGSSMRPVLVVN